MKMRLSILLLLAFTSTTRAQNGPCTEAAIRNAIQSKSITQTEDHYWYSGRMNKPAIGKASAQNLADKGMAVKKDDSPPEQPERIVVAPSGEMAYEYGTHHLVRELENGGHQDFTTVYLRVWKAVGTVCEQAAFQVAPQNLNNQLMGRPQGQVK